MTEQERFCELYDKIQDLFWEYPEFTITQIAENMYGAVLEHCTNHRDPGDWEKFREVFAP